MPLIKVHISSMEAPGKKPSLVKKLREVLVEKLNIDEKEGQVILYETFPQYRAIHADRSDRFVFMEVFLYSGRSSDIKASLINGLVEAVINELNIEIEDITCCLLEIPKENWN